MFFRCWCLLMLYIPKVFFGNCVRLGVILQLDFVGTGHLDCFTYYHCLVGNSEIAISYQTLIPNRWRELSKTYASPINYSRHLAAMCTIYIFLKSGYLFN